MSYDVAVWEGEPPSDDLEAARVYEAMWAEHEGAGESPSPAILKYAKTLTEKYPNLDELPDDDIRRSPWAESPIEANIMGPFFYFAMTNSGAGWALPFIAETARAHGLVCFDPQAEQLI